MSLAPLSPYDAGRQAHRDVEIVANPYQPGTPERSEWSAGWYRGRADYTKHRADKGRMLALSEFHAGEAKKRRAGKVVM